MKKCKRISACLLAVLCLLCALAMPAGAEGFEYGWDQDSNNPNGPHCKAYFMLNLDTHTAVAAAAADKYRAERKDKRKMLVASTASPFKFTRSVMEAIGAGTEGKDDFALADELSQMSGLSIPRAVEEIRTAPVVHKTTCEPGEMKQAIRKFLGIR